MEPPEEKSWQEQVREAIRNQSFRPRPPAPMAKLAPDAFSQLFRTVVKTVFTGPVLNDMRRAVLARDFKALRVLSETVDELAGLSYDFEKMGILRSDKDMLDRYRQLCVLLRRDED